MEGKEGGAEAPKAFPVSTPLLKKSGPRQTGLSIEPNQVKSGQEHWRQHHIVSILPCNINYQFCIAVILSHVSHMKALRCLKPFCGTSHSCARAEVGISHTRTTPDPAHTSFPIHVSSTTDHTSQTQFILLRLVYTHWIVSSFSSSELVLIL